MFVRTLGFVAATGLMTGLSNAASALPVAVPDLIAHRAVYDLELKDASDRSGIEGMTGRMVYEFTGSACQGYKTDFRFVTQINTGDAVRMTDQQTTTFEDIAAKNSPSRPSPTPMTSWTRKCRGGNRQQRWREGRPDPSGCPPGQSGRK